MPRKLERSRPKQGARLAALRRSAGLTQTELAQILGVQIEQILDGGDLPQTRRTGPVGKVQKIFEKADFAPAWDNPDDTDYDEL